MNCTSCHKNLLSEDNFMRFACPECAAEEITRCASCRVKGTLYTCNNCSFEGP